MFYHTKSQDRNSREQFWYQMLVSTRGVCKLESMLLLFWVLAFSCFMGIEADETDTISVDIGVIYRENDELGKMGYNCINMALSDFYNSNGHYRTRVALHTRLYHSNNSIVGAAFAAMYLLQNTEVKAIIGPTASTDAEFVMHLGESAQVPIISYSTTIPCVSSSQCSYLINIAENDHVQVYAIIALINAFQWKYVVPIYVENNGNGVGIIPYLDDALQNLNARIPFHEAISMTATDDQILKLLQKLKGTQTRVFVVDLSPELAFRLFLIANELEMMSQGYVWIVTTSISNELESIDDGVLKYMQGVVGVQTYVPETNDLKRFKRRWEREFQDSKLNVMGLWANDAAGALARAVEEIEPQNLSLKHVKMSDNQTDTDSFGVSSIGPQLLEALHNTNFTGLTRNFSLAKGQLGSSPSSPSLYKIINVYGSGINDVGFWTSEKGLVPNLNFREKNSAKNASLRPIIWPGDITLPPKGWEIPPSGKSLRVGVPAKTVYEQLVKLTQVQGRNGAPNSTHATGFCIAIFESVMKKLGYSHHYEYAPFPMSGIISDGSYDDLVHQVFLQKYDVAVGDITIIAKRASEVDFTLPFTESGVTLVVPVQDDKRSAWVFLQPLTWELWVATLCAFIFVAFSVWVLEHRINNEFRGPLLHQAGTSLFYSFSMMVFAQRENVLSNLTRCVVIVWVFVVLVLTQSYTASLTSMLTVQQLQPTVTGLDELMSTGAHVGVQEGTFVRDLLIHKGFHESKIVSYNTTQNLDELLSKGSGNGGIAAVFDEIPYMRLFLALFPSKYIMLQPTYKTDGFGFAFQKGSPLVAEVSREILRVTEGENMLKLEKIWGMQLLNTSEKGNTVTSTRLDLDSFWGLFLIVGIASGFSLLFFWVQFLYEQRDIWMNSNASVWTKIQMLAKAFENRDTAAQSDKKQHAQIPQYVENDQTGISGEVADHGNPVVDISPPRPSNYDNLEETLTFSTHVSPSQRFLDSD